MLLISSQPSDIELEKENGVYSQAINSTNLARRQSQEVRVPFGETNIEMTPIRAPIKLKKRESQIDPSVTISVKNVR